MSLFGRRYAQREAEEHLEEARCRFPGALHPDRDEEIRYWEQQLEDAEDDEW